MSAIEEKGESRVTITLTLPADLWKKCRFYKETAGANWSQVAENVFYEMVEYLDGLAAAIENTGDSASAERASKLYMHQMITSRLRKMVNLTDEPSSDSEDIQTFTLTD